MEPFQFSHNLTFPGPLQPHHKQITPLLYRDCLVRILTLKHTQCLSPEGSGAASVLVTESVRLNPRGCLAQPSEEATLEPVCCCSSPRTVTCISSSRVFDIEDWEGPVVVEEEAEDPGQLRAPHGPAGEPQAIHGWA